MIIISQDKDAIINFDNIDILGTGKSLEDNEGKSKILANTISDEQCVIAEYKTEERAQEVLDDIANTRAIFEVYKCSNDDVQDVFDKRMLKEGLIFDTYQMPKE